MISLCGLIIHFSSQFEEDKCKFFLSIFSENPPMKPTSQEHLFIGSFFIIVLLLLVIIVLIKYRVSPFWLLLCLFLCIQ